MIENNKNIELVKIDIANHGLECSDALKSIEILNTVMKALKKCINKHLKN